MAIGPFFSAMMPRLRRSLGAKYLQIEPAHHRQQVRSSLRTAHFKLAGGDRLRGSHRPVAARDIDIDAARLEIAKLACRVDVRVLPGREPREGVAHLRKLRDGGARKGKSCGGRCRCACEPERHGDAIVRAVPTWYVLMKAELNWRLSLVPGLDCNIALFLDVRKANAVCRSFDETEK